MTKIISNSPLLQYTKDDVEVVAIDNLFDGFFKMERYQLKHKLYQGGTSGVMDREIFERGNAVVLIPYDPVTDCVVLQEQYRVGAMNIDGTPWMLEFVAGMFDADERPIDVAIREAKEEANIDIAEKDILPVSQFLTSPGGTTECIDMFVGKVDSTVIGGIYGLPEEGEDILVHVVSREYALELLTSGKIINATTIIGLQWLALNYQKLQEKWTNE
jgi:ADP-ribose pyrophosphatase